jgi:hypothetical protein
MSDVLLLACQHMLGPQLKMFELFLKAGLSPENCIIAGKSYSTNKSACRDLAELGCAIAPFSGEFHPLQSFDEWFDRSLDSFLAKTLAQRKVDRFRRIIVLDDGGFMHHAAVRQFGSDPRLGGIEQTTSGWHRISGSNIRFARYMVARSHYKQYEEAPFIGECGIVRILEHLRKRGKQDPNILVLGLGTIGRQIAGRLFLIHGLRGSAADLNFTDEKKGLRHFGGNQLLECRGRCLEYREAMSRLREFDVIVGATGFPAVTEADIGRLHPEVSLISMSSSDREFPVLHFRRRGDLVHDDCYRDSRCLVNAGFPITFSGARHEIRPIEIEMTIAQLQACAMDLSGRETGCYIPHLPLALEQAHGIWQMEVHHTPAE